MSRLLLVNTDLELGGTPEVVRQLARQFSAAGHDVEVACLGRFGPVAEQITVEGTPVHAFDCGPLALPIAVWKLRRLVAARRIDRMLSFLVHANTVAALASLGMRDVRWFQSVQTTQPYPAWHWRLQGLVESAAERVICPSQSVADAAAERSNIARRKLHVIPNGVDAVVDRPRPQTAGELRVGFLGRLDPIKRVGVLINAVRELDHVTLDIFGDGPARQRLVSHGVGRFHGNTPRDDALSAMDVLVLPSSAEGMPMVLLEAMAAGLPVVAFDVPGCRDVIRDGVDGLLLEHIDDLRPALVRLRDDPALRERLAAEGLQTARAHLWRNIAGEYARVLHLDGQ